MNQLVEVGKAKQQYNKMAKQHNSPETDISFFKEKLTPSGGIQTAFLPTMLRSYNLLMQNGAVPFQNPFD